MNNDECFGGTAMNRILLLTLAALIMTGCVVREDGGYYSRGYGYGDYGRYGYSDYDRHGRYEQRGEYRHWDDEHGRYWR
jgi:hypothetical protein